MTFLWSGNPYEAYIGRWSRLVAAEFVHWIGAPERSRWLDVGCGTGALSASIIQFCGPESIDACDPSADMLPVAQELIPDPRTSFCVGNAQDLPFESARFDIVVSGLVLNFIPDLPVGLDEMVRVARPGGTVAAYVWDYAGGMQLIRTFWAAAVALDPAARELDEGVRFPICQPEALESAFRAAGLADARVDGIEVPTVFRDFDDLWMPFLGSAGPAPNYTTSLGAEQQAALREQLRANLPLAPDGSIALIARAWAVRGRVM